MDPLPLSKPPTLENFYLKDLNILLRVDFNVPIDLGVIRDDMRIQAALPTIRHLLAQGASLVIMSHLGSPGSYDANLSLKPVAERLQLLLNHPVHFAHDCIGTEATKLTQKTSTPFITLLENLRFHVGEKNLADEPGFVDELAKMGDFYVNEAFGTAHRLDSSCVALARAFKGRSAMGFLMQKEWDFLTSHLENPVKPFFALVGGSKISSKLMILEKLLDRCDGLIIFGAMAYTFLAAQGISVGKSLVEEDCIAQAKNIMEKASLSHKQLQLPLDHVICEDLRSGRNPRVIPLNEQIPENFYGVDIGPVTVRAIEEILKPAKTIFWNGPAGIFEQSQFARGTQAIAQILASHSAITIIGGGDSAAAVNEMGLTNQMSHVSTGGGASLELIEKGQLPAFTALMP
jgi:phosphoglycerate kinase